ncbi:13611_t:CDS:1, partial [Acaulospora morrowiae]
NPIINATEHFDCLEWIPWNHFDVVEYAGQGGFGTVYCAYWIEGPRRIWDEEVEDWLRNGPTKVAIKKIKNSKNLSKLYLNRVEITNFYWPMVFNVTYVKKTVLDSHIPKV